MPHREELHSAYIDALIAEAKQRREEVGSDFYTLYIGGGTPSVLSKANLQRLVFSLSEIYNLSENGERTIEVNPDDITDEYVDFLASLGFNRISMGVQSFNNPTLKLINRSHDRSSALAALEVLASKQWNYNADLIYGLPGEGLVEFADNLKMLLEFHPKHISAYALMIEQGTKLWAMAQAGKFQPCTDDEFVAIYRELCETLRSYGYEHYEISNFAKPGFRAIHNCRYWDFTPYLGLGPGAHSFDGSLRRFNPTNLKAYLGTLADNQQFFKIEAETVVDQLNDYIFTSLRTAAGISKKFLERRFPSYAGQLWNELAKHPQILTNAEFGRVDEKNWLMSDAIIRDLLIV